MADVVAAPPGAAVPEGDAAPAAPQQNFWTIAKTLVSRMLFIYFISSLVRNWSGNQRPVKSTNGTEVAGSVPLPSRNMFPKGVSLDLYVYLSTSDTYFNKFDEPSSLFWSHFGLVYGDWKNGPNEDGTYTYEGTIPCTENLQNNGSIYIHTFVTKHGYSPNPAEKGYSKTAVIYTRKLLNKFKKKKYQKTANLLTGETKATEDEIKKQNEGVKAEILSHWHPNLTLNLIDDHTAWTQGTLPPPLDEFVKFDHVSGDYYPIFFYNDYWNLMSEYTPINDTVKELTLCLTYAPMSLFKWQLYASQQMRNKWTSMIGGDMFEDGDQDQDSLKQAILDTNPYLLGATMVVSVLHTIFEFLAFKNDIQFWRSRKSLEGLSVRSVIFNLFQSLIVLLYILDNETNFVIKVSVFVGLLIELWKIPKVMDVKINYERRLFGIPTLSITDKGSYVQSSTREYDRMAFRYLSWGLYPLLGAYAVYSVVYNEHRGWYSFVLSMLYGFLLTFGFIMMTPQLFINYKLKSVAHLPWRMLTYKFLNTFIDDIFAFVIKMPTMYRIGCFRDDIVFLVYVYQRYIYRVDHSRVNEFGTTGEMHGEGENPAITEGGGGSAAITEGGGEGEAITQGEGREQNGTAVPDESKKDK